MNKEVKRMEITLEQQKLISSPLRVQIVYLLAEKPMTAKQVADELAKTAGSIHYHIQQLYKAGFVEIVETRENKGIIEKYYAAKATEFHLKDKTQTPGVTGRGASIALTDEELKQFEKEFDSLLDKWVRDTVKSKEGRIPYDIYCQFKKLDSGEE